MQDTHSQCQSLGAEVEETTHLSQPQDGVVVLRAGDVCALTQAQAGTNQKSIEWNAWNGIL